MHIENMKKVREAVANSPAFDMSSYLATEEELVWSAEEFKNHRTKNPCGTTACIAGEAFLLSGEVCNYAVPNETIHSIAKKWLGLDSATAESLFFGYWGNFDYIEEITKEDAVRVLDYLMAGGDINTYQD